MNKYIFYILLCYININFAQEKSAKEDTNGYINLKTLPDNFKENYTDAIFIYEYDFDPNKRSLWDQFTFWFKKKMKEWFGLVDDDKAARYTNNIFKLLYFLVFATVLFLLLKTFLNKEGSWVFGRSSSKLNLKSSLLKEELLETNYKDLITKAKQKKNYRLAIRYYYLMSLKNLTNKKIIDWDNEKTNHDYLNEIKDKNLKEEFKYVSYIYDYCWYGEFRLTENSFTEAENKFNHLIQNTNGKT